MCGIAGVAANWSDASVDVRHGVARMCQVLRARGPDDEGLYVSGDRLVGLGNRRLAIQDLSPAGHMPMCNPDTTVCITYNGEIYNADELRGELRALGLSFRSHSDTEVILRGYEVWGQAIVDRLRGMFAFAIYDRRAPAAPKLFLARDPLGIKPLYYVWRDGILAFASECRALRAAAFSSQTIDPVALATYLRLGSVPAPLTIYSDIRALEAGATLELVRDVDRWRLVGPTAGWQPPCAPHVDRRRRSHSDVVDEVGAVLRDSVRRHLVSDVPLGAFLSGGIDSSTVVAMMREANPGGVIRTCSIAFRERAYNEADLAHEVAQRFGTDHVEILVEADDLRREMDSIITCLDQPSNDGLNTYMVSKAARSASLTVALSGLGGDELFGGYPTFRRLGPLVRAAAWARAIPGGMRVLGRGLEAPGEHRPSARLGGWLRRGSSPAVYLGLRGLFSDRQMRHLLTKDVLHEQREELDLVELVGRSAGYPSHQSGWDAAARYELTCYMRHQLLRDTDVMSMAHSLEVRVPFVDRAVVQRVLALDVRTLPGGLPKQVLRDVSPSLPDAIRTRRDKQGFSFPFQPWLSGPLRPTLEELMRTAESQLAGYLRPGSSEYLLRAFDAGQVHWSRPWALAALCSAFTTPAALTRVVVEPASAAV
jgi:asparagine synthase (glutamine-hydrolysing)